MRTFGKTWMIIPLAALVLSCAGDLITLDESEYSGGSKKSTLIDPELAGVKIEKPAEEKKTTRKRAIRKTSTASSKKAADANDME